MLASRVAKTLRNPTPADLEELRYDLRNRIKNGVLTSTKAERNDEGFFNYIIEELVEHFSTEKKAHESEIGEWSKTALSEAGIAFTPDCADCLAAITAAMFRDATAPESRAILARLWNAFQEVCQPSFETNRMLPDPESNIESLCAGIDSLQPRYYDVLFPVVSSNNLECGFVLQSRVWVFREPNSADAASLAIYEKLPDNAASQYRCTPWSPLTVEKDTIKEVTAAINGIKITDLKISQEEKWLLEILPVAGSVCTTHLVSGESLGVAVLLSIYATRNNLNLKPIVVTGKLSSNSISEIKHVLAKQKIILQWIRDANLSEPYPLSLVPEDNWGQLVSIFEHFPRQNTPRPANVVGGIIREKDKRASLEGYALPKVIGDLVSWRDTLLTDGCDAYRAAIGDLEDSSDEQCEETGHAIMLPTPSGARDASLHAMCFDVPPRGTLRNLIRRLQKTIAEYSDVNEFHPMLLPVVFPLDLSLDCNSSAAERIAISTIARAIQSGIAKLFPASKLNPISGETLNRILRGADWSRVVMIGFDESSTKINYSATASLLESLETEIRARITEHRPTLQFIASDEHHARFLRANLSGINFHDVTPVAAYNWRDAVV